MQISKEELQALQHRLKQKTSEVDMLMARMAEAKTTAADNAALVSSCSLVDNVAVMTMLLS